MCFVSHVFTFSSQQFQISLFCFLWYGWFEIFLPATNFPAPASALVLSCVSVLQVASLSTLLSFSSTSVFLFVIWYLLTQWWLVWECSLLSWVNLSFGLDLCTYAQWVVISLWLSLFPSNKQSLIFWTQEKFLSFSRTGFPNGSSGKESACNAGDSKDRFTPWKRKWQTTPVFLPGESHRQRSLVGYSFWEVAKSLTVLSMHASPDLDGFLFFISSSCSRSSLCFGASRIATFSSVS